MSNKIDWSKAPEGATHYTPKGTGVYAAFWRKHCGEWKDAWVIEGQDGQLVHYKGPLSPSFESLAVERPTTPSWSGEGLPPVGVRCEAAIPHTSGPDNERSFIWIEGSVIAYYEIKGKTYAWFSEDDGFYPPGVFEFRPIRTPEQIAADEREAAISALVEEMKAKRYALEDTDVSPSEIARHYAQALYDAGYRKP